MDAMSLEAVMMIFRKLLISWATVLKSLVTELEIVNSLVCEDRSVVWSMFCCIC